MEAAGCYGRNCADDVAADAALLSRAVGAPVRVQLTREQENLWEPKGAAQLMQVNGGLECRRASIAAYDFQTSYPSQRSAHAGAAAHTQRSSPRRYAYEMGDRTAVPPYDYAKPARGRERHGADSARLVAARCVGACRTRSRTSRMSMSSRPLPAPTRSQFRLQHLKKDERASELVQAPPPHAPAGSPTRSRSNSRRRRQRAQGPGLRLRALCAQQVSRLRRRVGGVGRRCGGEPRTPAKCT